MYPRFDIYKDDKSLFSIVLDSDEKLEICENSFTWNSFKVTTNFDWNNIKNGFKRLIKEIDSQDMLPFRIIENREYILETNTNILLEIPTLVNEVHSFANIFKPIPRSTSTDSKQFRLLISQYLGMMDLSIGGQKYILEIESEKLDFEDEFEGMLNDLNQDCVQLMQDWSSPTYMGFNEEPERQRKTLLEQFIVIRQTINSSQLKSWFGMIHQNPHQALVKEEEWKPIFLADPYLYLTDPFKYGREGSFDITEKYHTEIINIKKTISVDTPPNRFIKYVINEIDNVCSLLLDRIAASTSIKNNKEAISNEIKQVRENNRELLFHPFLKEIKPLSDFPLANQTLQKRSGYKEILYLWLRMQMASKLNWKSRTDFYESDLLYTFIQTNYCYYLNLIHYSYSNNLAFNKDLNQEWYGSRMGSYINIKDISLNALRIQQNNSIANGGWHFSYMGGLDNIKQKLSATSAQELNNDKILNSLETNFNNNQDIIYRDGSTLIKVDIDETYPGYLIKNINKYNHLIQQ